MISYCKSITTTRKKFSDFEFLDATSSEDLDSVYLAGYKENKDGTRENIRIRASAVVNTQLGTIIGTLDEKVDEKGLQVVTEKLNFDKKKILVINNSDTSFYQLNKISPSLFSRWKGMDVLFIRFSDDTPWGKVTKLYLPNFPFNKGLALLPSTGLDISQQTPKLVFFNHFIGEDVQEDYDYYTTFIQLADPLYKGGDIIMNTTKVVECVNITNEYESDTDINGDNCGHVPSDDEEEEEPETPEHPAGCQCCCCKPGNTEEPKEDDEDEEDEKDKEDEKDIPTIGETDFPEPDGEI